VKNFAPIGLAYVRYPASFAHTRPEKIQSEIDFARLMLHVGLTPGWRGVCVKHGSGESMRVEVKRKSLGARGGPEFGAPLVYASIPVIDDGEASSRASAGRCDREHHAPFRPTPRMAHRFSHWCAPRAAHRITAFRHSVDGLAARFARRCGRWDFGEDNV
jgi:hypothetical protein